MNLRKLSTSTLVLSALLGLVASGCKDDSPTTKKAGAKKRATIHNADGATDDDLLGCLLEENDCVVARGCPDAAWVEAGDGLWSQGDAIDRACAIVQIECGTSTSCYRPCYGEAARELGMCELDAGDFFSPAADACYDDYREKLTTECGYVPNLACDACDDQGNACSETADWDPEDPTSVDPCWDPYIACRDAAGCP
jgi:hypothetical protein